MIALFSDPFLKEYVAFRGGTALHKIYLKPQARYSEDIDLVQIKEGPIKPILQVPNAVDAQIKERLFAYWNEGEIVEMLGVLSLFGYLNRWNDSMGTSIEACDVESADQYLGKHGWEKGKYDGVSFP